MPYRYQKSAPFIRIRDLITIHYYEIAPDFTYPGERHPFWEIVYIDDGTIHVCNDRTDWYAQAGELLVHAPDVYHYAKGDGMHRGHIFIITFTTRSPVMAQFRDLCMVLPHRMRTLISAIIHEASLTYDMEGDGLYPLSNAPKGGRQLVCLYLEELLILLYRQLTDTTGIVPAKELPGEMILYLNSHVYDRLSVSDLCQRMHYGKTHLSQLFREATGDSIMQYYRRLKINEAKRLLRDPEQTVAEVAALLGFDTPQYFTRVFKSHTGLTPAEWRDSLQNGQNPELNPERLPRKKEK